MILTLSRRFGDALPHLVRQEDVSVIRMLELEELGKVSREDMKPVGSGE